MGWRRCRSCRLMRVRRLRDERMVIFSGIPSMLIKTMRPFAMLVVPNAMPISIFVPIAVVRRTKIRIIRIIVPSHIIVDA